MFVIVSFVVLFAAVVVLAYLLWQINSRLSKLVGGGKPDDLEATLVDFLGRVKKLEQSSGELGSQLDDLGLQTNLASQKISIVRFNPFGDTGGDQSFSLAVLDAHKSGYVLTGIHGRESSRVYLKPIDLGVSKYALSNEEKQAIDQARRRIAPKVRKEAHG